MRSYAEIAAAIFPSHLCMDMPGLDGRVPDPKFGSQSILQGKLKFGKV